MARTSVRRDPSAREELVRRSYSVHNRKECAWCGQKHRVMFTYEVETDGGRRCGESKQVCNINCYKNYYLSKF